MTRRPIKKAKCPACMKVVTLPAPVEDITERLHYCSLACSLKKKGKSDGKS